MSKKTKTDIDEIADLEVTITIRFSVKNLVRLMKAVEKGDPVIAPVFNRIVMESLEKACENIEDGE